MLLLCIKGEEGKKSSFCIGGIGSTDSVLCNKVIESNKGDSDGK